MSKSLWTWNIWSIEPRNSCSLLNKFMRLIKGKPICLQMIFLQCLELETSVSYICNVNSFYKWYFPLPECFPCVGKLTTIKAILLWLQRFYCDGKLKMKTMSGSSCSHNSGHHSTCLWQKKEKRRYFSPSSSSFILQGCVNMSARPEWDQSAH